MVVWLACFVSIFSAAAESKELAAAYAKLELYKANAASLDETLKLSRKEVAAVKGVVEEQRAWMDAVGARMAEL